MKCEFCNHEDKDHCKGGELHSDHKEDARMVEIKYRKGSRVCVSRHCDQPLCCCLAFIAPIRETRQELAEFAERIARDNLREEKNLIIFLPDAS